MEPLNLPAGYDDQFTIAASSLSQGEVIITCRGIGGNRPRSYRNNIAVWSGSLPNLSSNPLHVLSMPDDNWPTRVPFRFGFGPNDYCFTYQTGPNISTMCALTLLNAFPTAAPPLPTSVSLEKLDVTTKSVRVRYTTLPGYQPQKYGNWIGIWGGYAIPYDSPPPIGQATINSYQSQDIVTIENLSLSPGGNYTLIYFMQKDGVTAAGSLLYFLFSE